MSFVKWRLTQQALPKSAILTDIVSVGRSSDPFSSEAGLDLPKSMLDTSRVSESLLYVRGTKLDIGNLESVLTPSFLFVTVFRLHLL